MIRAGRGEIIYGSAFQIFDPTQLASLALFYDRVYLPAGSAFGYSDQLPYRQHEDGSFEITGYSVGMIGNLCSSDWDSVFAETARWWEKEHQVLFDEKVLLRLDDPDLRQTLTPGYSSPMLDRALSLLEAVGAYSTYESDFFDIHNETYVDAHLLRHWLRDDIGSGQFFTQKGTMAKREVWKQALAHCAISYVLPQISSLNVDQILEARSLVSDTREGFAMHLQKLTRLFDEKVDRDAEVNEVINYAKDIAETELIPDYHEFRRQLMSKKAGWWGDVLSKTSEVMQIDAAPWTPAFYLQLFKALGFTALEGVSKESETLSNEYQTYQFMTSLEGASFNSRCES